MSSKGRCLCGAICFEIKKKIEVIYHCHCSLCRKQTGAAANAATLVPLADFVWKQGQDSIQTYQRETGFTTCFCPQCGSPVPNRLREPHFVWIPLGLLDSPILPTKCLHLCLSSQATWAKEKMAEIPYDALPSWETIQALFDN